MKKNTFSKALKHLKTLELDEKIKNLNEGPTNNITSFYSLNPPGFRQGPLDPEKVFYPDAEGNWPDGVPGTAGEFSYTRPAGYWDNVGQSEIHTLTTVDFTTLPGGGHPNYLNTEQYIRSSDGYVLAALPPNSRDFILGPLIDSFIPNHYHDAYTRIGYIQKDTKSFVLLGRIPGQWFSNANKNTSGTPWPNIPVWDGTSTGFISYNDDFKLEHAQWFREQMIAGRYTENVPYYAAGGVGQSYRTFTDSDGNVYNSVFFAGFVPDDGKRGGPNDRIGDRQGASRSGGPEDAGFPWANLKVPLGLLNSIVNPNMNKMLARLVMKLGDKGMELINMAINDGSISKVIEFGSKIVGYETAGKFLNKYNQFLNDPSGEGSSSENPIDLTSEVSIDDLNLLDKFINNNREIQKERQNLLDGKYSDRIIQIPNNPPTSEQDLRKEILKGKIEAQVRKAIEKSPGLDNSLHNNVQVDIDQSLESGTTVLTKQYVFRPGGSVAEAENNIVGKILTAVGVDLDTIGSGGPKEFWGGLVASSIGLTNSEQHGGVYKSPGMYYKIVIPNGGGIKESREVLTESRKRILREIKNPYELPEIPQPKKLKKYKPNFAGKYSPQNTPDATASQQSDSIVKAKNAAGQTWRTQDKHWSRYQSQERMNIIFDHVGHGKIYWDEIVAHNQGKKGWRDRDIQEKLNMHQALLGERKIMEEHGIYEQETLNAPNDPLIKRIKNKLATEIDYPNKPSASGFPDDMPPQMVNGFHPEYGKRANYYNSLDTQSADSMPDTGDEEIDAKVRAQKTKVQRIREIRNKKK